MKSINKSFSFFVIFSILFTSMTFAQSVSISNRTYTFPSTDDLNGDILIFGGLLLDRAGSPLSNAVIEIWQTDNFGIYNHPSDPNTTNRDLKFQFFGTSVTDEDGRYVFRTVLPGEYRPRPRHIHFKVKISGRTVLTSQLYFTIPDRASTSDNQILTVQLEQIDDQRRQYYLGQYDIVLANESGTLAATPSQMEGPYYPVVDFSSFNNDLLITN